MDVCKRPTLRSFECIPLQDHDTSAVGMRSFLCHTFLIRPANGRAFTALLGHAQDVRRSSISRMLAFRPSRPPQLLCDGVGCCIILSRNVYLTTTGTWQTQLRSLIVVTCEAIPRGRDSRHQPDTFASLVLYKSSSAPPNLIKCCGINIQQKYYYLSQK